MATIAEISGLIVETLRLQPEFMHQHVKGLLAAGRLDEGECYGIAAANLICACLTTDPGNATGPFHLPFVGGQTFDSEFQVIEEIEPDHPAFHEVEGEFGDRLARYIETRAAGERPAGGVHSFTILGRGDLMSARIRICGTPRGGKPANEFWAIFGYMPRAKLLRALNAPRAEAEVAITVGGQVLDALAELISTGAVTHLPPALSAPPNHVVH